MWKINSLFENTSVGKCLQDLITALYAVKDKEPIKKNFTVHNNSIPFFFFPHPFRMVV